MSLHCLAILGNKSEPLYFYSPPDAENEKESSSEEDVFGFQAMDTESSGLSMRQEFMMHAALDRLEEILGSPKEFDIVKMQRGSKWLGSLLPMEDYEIYGYVTPSCTKFLALIERDSVIPLKKRREVEIRALLTNIHDCYVQYTMNPFTKVRGKIEKPCSTFEAGIENAVKVYREAVAKHMESTSNAEQ